jgi:hypothetical protein
MHICIVCLSLTIYHHVSIAVSTTIRVTYKNIKNPNNVKIHKLTTRCIRKYPEILHSHWILAYLLLKSNKIIDS